MVSKDVEFSGAESFDLCEKFARRCPPTQTPTQKLKHEFSIISSKESAPSLISLEMVFEYLQSEAQILSYLDSSMIHRVEKSKKVPKFNLTMNYIDDK